MTTTRHRANPLMLLSGLLLIIVGLVVMLGGVAWALAAFGGLDPPQLSDLGSGPEAYRDDFQPMLDGFAAFAIGTSVLTIGRYLWRGARRRGWRDRLVGCSSSSRASPSAPACWCSHGSSAPRWASPTAATPCSAAWLSSR